MGCSERVVRRLGLGHHLKQDTRLAQPEGAGIWEGSPRDRFPLEGGPIGRAEVDDFCALAVPSDFTVMARHPGGNNMDMSTGAPPQNR